MGSQPPLGIHLSQRGSLHGLQGYSCLTVVCRGISALVAGAPPSLSLAWCLQGCFSQVLLHLCPAAIAQGVFPLPNSVISEAPQPLPTDSALAKAGSDLEPTGVGSVGYRRSFQQLLKEATPAVPLCQNLA